MTSNLDAASLRAADPAGMLRSIDEMGEQLRDGYRAGLATVDLPTAEGVGSVAVCGMGGSGLPGDVVRTLLHDRLGVPIAACKGYRLPEFCKTDTLVLAVSYSGNTEETITCYREAVTRGCRVVVLASGGELAARADEDGVPVVRVPTTFPVPRAALGYLSGAALGVLEATELGPAEGPGLDEAARVLDAGRESFGPEAAPNGALDLAGRIGDRAVVIWGSEGIGEAVALRWKSDVNENAKRPAFASVLSELDHHEIEGWSDGAGRGFFLVIVRSPSEHHSIGPRVEATLHAIEGSGLEHDEVHAVGDAPLAQLFSLAQLADYVSCYLAIGAGVDPRPIERIQAMKAHLEGLG